MEKVFSKLERGVDLSIRMLLCKMINERIHGVLSLKQQSTCFLFISSFSTSNCLHSSALSYLEAIKLPMLKTPHHKTNKSQDIQYIYLQVCVLTFVRKECVFAAWCV